MKYVFGPVPSRRLGNSLGVDLVVMKTCSFDCVYCQLGRTTDHTTQRRRFVPPDDVLAEIDQTLASGAEIDYITLSGSGEPTLSTDIGTIIRAIKERTDIPVAVLTNGSLLDRPDVQADLADADLLVPSLDAATPQAFERVNRPAPGLDLQAVLRGIRDFSHTFAGHTWLEVMVVAGINDTPDEARAIADALAGARIHTVHVNTVARAPAEPWAKPVPDAQLEELAAILGRLAPVHVIRHYSREGHASYRSDVVEAILATLARRPCGAIELAASLGLAPNLVIKHIEELEHQARIERILVADAVQYRLPPAKPHTEPHS